LIVTSPLIVTSLEGLPAFAGYLAAAVALCALYLVVYTRIMPYDEFDLIVHKHNASAALSLGMSLIGFTIPLASAILHAATILDCLVWGVVALITQILAYFLARLSHPALPKAIEQNALAAALWLGFVSISIGMISAASMSY
jgi:putative membrane protein